MQPIKRVRLSDQVIDAIKEMISKEKFKVGDKFYSENQLVKKLNVSRSSIREAVRMLEVTGFVNVKHGKGIFIADTHGESFEAFREWMKNNETALLEHFEVRLMIDPKAAACAAENAEEFEIDAMEEVLKDFIEHSKIQNMTGLIKTDEEFHKILAKSTKNRTLYMLMKTMAESLSEGWITSLNIPGRIEKTIIEHGNIIKAIKSGNSKEAERVMRKHIKNALQDIKESIQNS